LHDVHGTVLLDPVTDVGVIERQDELVVLGLAQNLGLGSAVELLGDTVLTTGVVISLLRNRLAATGQFPLDRFRQQHVGLPEVGDDGGGVVVTQHGNVFLLGRGPDHLTALVVDLDVTRLVEDAVGVPTVRFQDKFLATLEGGGFGHLGKTNFHPD